MTTLGGRVIPPEILDKMYECAGPDAGLGALVKVLMDMILDQEKRIKELEKPNSVKFIQAEE